MKALPAPSKKKDLLVVVGTSARDNEKPVVRMLPLSGSLRPHFVIPETTVWRKGQNGVLGSTLEALSHQVLRPRIKFSVIVVLHKDDDCALRRMLEFADALERHLPNNQVFLVVYPRAWNHRLIREWISRHPKRRARVLPAEVFLADKTDWSNN